MGLKGIPEILSPELIYALAQMGHGDELVLADANFPASSMCSGGAKYVSAHGHGIPDLLEAIMKLFPLDTYNFNPVLVMDLVNRDKNKGMESPAIWKNYQAICDAAHGEKVNILQVERFDFYERAKKAFCIVATTEQAPYGNIIVKKGCIRKETDTVKMSGDVLSNI